ncbi:MAG: penicillin-binding protein [Frankiaceae bacterium]|nr:penicillin-binding protein [Frankiaceae bacterium]
MAGSSRGSDPIASRLGLALVVSVVMGLLLAALALPVVGAIGLTAKSSADDFLALPADLEAGPPAQRSKILASDGTLLATMYSQNRVNVPLHIVPLAARQAIIAIEDSRFYAHHGVDYKGIIRAAVTNAGAGGVKQGASTLTQQYVKNALIESATDKAGQRAAKADSIERKLREARYAIALERKLTKDQILERYLNIAYFGHGVYGIGTAANYYFAKPVNRLNLAQSALLAGMVQNPNTYDPSSKEPSIRAVTKARRDVVLRRMQELGFISDAQRLAGEKLGIFTALRPVGSGCEDAAVQSPFFCDYVRHILEDTPAGRSLGQTRNERQRALLGGGLTIRTTLDPKAQLAAQTAVDEKVPRHDKSGAAVAINMVEPGTGNLKAMAVNRTYSDEKGASNTKVNLATGGQFGYQAGSTFKAFVIAEALRQGIPLSLTMHAPQTYTSKVFNDYKDGQIGPYKISNAGDSEAGTFNLTTATALSVNTYFLQLEERTGVEKPAALAESMGVRVVKNFVADQPLGRGGSFVLGSYGVSPLDMAAAYATFAAHGLYCPPRVVTEIVAPDRKPLTVPQEDCQQVLEPGVADTVTSLLRGVIDGPVHGRTGSAASIGRPAAGKTGTVNESRAAWFVGYTPELATSVWLGMPNPTPGPKYGVPEPMKSVTINHRFYKQVYGGSLPAPIWKQAMGAALDGVPVQQFTAADQTVVDGEKVPVPDVSGQPYETAKQTLIDAGFGVRSGGFVPAAPVPFGVTPYTSPAAGRMVTVGTTITVYQSNGRERPPSPSPATSPLPGEQSPPPPQPSPKPSPSKKRGRG